MQTHMHTQHILVESLLQQAHEKEQHLLRESEHFTRKMLTCVVQERVELSTEPGKLGNQGGGKNIKGCEDGNQDKTEVDSNSSNDNGDCNCVLMMSLLTQITRTTSPQHHYTGSPSESPPS